jgi:hypothetical protein
VTQFRHSSVREAKTIHADNIRVGAAMPHHVTEYWVPVPTTVVETFPAWPS